MKFNAKKLTGATVCGLLATIALVSCGSNESAVGWAEGTSTETIIKEAYEANQLGNWGLGNEYEIYALEQKYGLEPKYATQGFDMSQFDDDELTVASVMTYNELGLTKNSYSDTCLGLDGKVGVIDMNEEGVAMLEDSIICTSSFATANPYTVKAFLYASIKGWAYACDNTDEAAQICVDAGASSLDHQKYMAAEMASACKKDTTGATVEVDLTQRTTALENTLSQAKTYVANALTDTTAKTKLANMELTDFVDSSYLEAVQGDDVTAESIKSALTASGNKTDVKMQLKWLPQAQFMGFYVAEAKGYFEEVGLNVTLLTQSGDITETNYVNEGNADFGHTWVSSTIAANAGGAELIQVGQITQRSCLQLVYKYK